MRKLIAIALCVLFSGASTYGQVCTPTPAPLTPFRTLSQTTAHDLNLWKFNPSSWWTDACPTCRVEAVIDWVLPSGTGTMLAGWGFGCADGLPADRVDVWYEDDNGVSHPQKSELRYRHVDRPDVTTFSQNIGCTPAYNPGFGVVVATPTTGYRAVRANVWRSGLMHPPIRIALR